MTTKVTISFTMTLTDKEMKKTLKPNPEYPRLKLTNPYDWGVELAETIKQQWEGYGEGKIYRSEISVDVKTN